MQKRFKSLVVLLIILSVPYIAQSQGFGIPTKKFGIGFGNLPTFTGVRLNAIDRNVESISGINITGWTSNSFDEQTGSFYGLGLGLPMAMGTENRYGISAGIFATAATEDLMGINIGGIGVGGNNVYGINIGGLAAGAGENLMGINIGGLASGAGENLAGLNIGGLAVGSGQNVSGISVGGLAVGSGNNLTGFSAAFFAVGAGNSVKGITIGGLAAGAGDSMIGLNVGGLAVGAGSSLKGINIGGLGVGAGYEVVGLNISTLAVGAPNVKGITLAGAAGGEKVTGLTVAFGYLRVMSTGDNDRIPTMTGVSISAFNHIQGVQKGLTIGIFNYAHKVKGVQIGLLNYNRSNPKGLRWLPIVNAGFGGR